MVYNSYIIAKMHNLITFIQITLGVLLIILVLMQNRSSGMGSSFGSGGMSYHSKRGLESMLLKVTIVISILFVTISVGAVMVPA